MSRVSFQVVSLFRLLKARGEEVSLLRDAQECFCKSRGLFSQRHSLRDSPCTLLCCSVCHSVCCSVCCSVHTSLRNSDRAHFSVAVCVIVCVAVCVAVCTLLWEDCPLLRLHSSQSSLHAYVQAHSSPLPSSLFALFPKKHSYARSTSLREDTLRVEVWVRRTRGHCSASLSEC